MASFLRFLIIFKLGAQSFYPGIILNTIFGNQNPHVTHFYDLYHGNCTVKYVGGFIFGFLNDNLMSKRPILETNSQNRKLQTDFGYLNPPMAHFHGISHGNCALKLKLRKLNFNSTHHKTSIRLHVFYKQTFLKIGSSMLRKSQILGSKYA